MNLGEVLSKACQIEFESLLSSLTPHVMCADSESKPPLEL